MPQLDFFTPKSMTMASLPGQYGENTGPIAASSGIQGSPRPDVLDNMLGTVPPGPHGHRNGQQSRSIFSVVDFMTCITVAKRPCYCLLKIKPSIYYSLLCINLVRIL